MPPSVLYIVTSVAHMPGRFRFCVSLKIANEADWMDNLVLTMSRGYVKVTEVMPAAAPQNSLRIGVRSAPGEASIYCQRSEVSI